MFSHVDEKNFPKMVDVSNKNETIRTAIAKGCLNVPASLFENFDGSDLQSKKGPVFSTAIVAATMAVKKTSDLIPFCHPIPIEACKVEIYFATPTVIEICVEVKTSGKTGIEMEAITGVQIAALTLYDMCKSWTHDLEISHVRLVKKTGGKSDYDKSEIPGPLYGLVLSGGESSRMKRDKGELFYHGISQVEQTYNLLKEFCSEVFVSCRKEQSEKLHLKNLPQIHDRYLNFGPLGAILSAMSSHRNASWLVLACDLPLMNKEVLHKIIDQRDNQKVATAYYNTDEKRFEPLAAIYEPTSYHPLFYYLAEGKNCPQKVLFNFPVKKIDFQNNSLLAKSLSNANTPEDYENALMLIQD